MTGYSYNFAVTSWLSKLESPLQTPTPNKRKRDHQSESKSENVNSHSGKRAKRKRGRVQTNHRSALTEIINIPPKTMAPQESPRRQSPRKKAPVSVSREIGQTLAWIANEILEARTASSNPSEP